MGNPFPLDTEWWFLRGRREAKAIPTATGKGAELKRSENSPKTREEAAPLRGSDRWG